MLEYNNNQYKHNVPYPSKSDFNRFHVYKNGEVIVSNLSPEEFIEQGRLKFPNTTLTSTVSVESLLKKEGYIVEVVVNEQAYIAAKKKYADAEKDVDLRWQKDLSDHYGIDFINDPIGTAILSVAWSKGHSAGLQEVDNCLSDIIEFTERILSNVSKSDYAKLFTGKK